MEDFKFSDFEFGGIDKFETQEMPDSRRAEVHRAKHVVRRGFQTRELSEIMPEISEGNIYHVVSRGNFDSFNFLPLIIERHGEVDEYLFTTWALNRDNVVDMLELFDQGKVLQIEAFVGTYLKRRETAVYGLLFDGLQKRGQRMKAFRNHSKIQLFRVGDLYVVVEGSANLTANGNCENFVVSVDRGVWEFHAGWLREIMAK